MSEFWKSNERYWCKYCNISIADNVAQRKQHEGNAKHKGNYERYINNMYKKGGMEKREKEETAREMERVNAAANKAMGIVEPKAGPSKSNWSKNDISNYSSAVDLGLVDAAELADSASLEQGVRIGDWQEVRVKSSSKGKRKQGDGEGAEEQEEEQEDEEDAARRPKKLMTERVAALEDVDGYYDPGAFAPIALKRKRLTLAEQEALEASEAKKTAEDERVKAEEQAAIRKAKASASGGWVTEDVKEEPMLEFEDLPAAAAPSGEIQAADVKLEGGEDVKPKVENEAAAAPAATGGFKKRKMHGAATARKK